MEPEVAAVTGLCVLLTVWYGGGHLVNRRRGQHLFRWLEAGLDVLGKEREAGWIGSPASGARVNVVHAVPPFRRLEITLLLENREILPLWLFDRLRGKRDWLIIKATLRSPRRSEVDITATRKRSTRRQGGPWKWEEGPHRLAVASQGPGAEKLVSFLRPWLETYGAHLHRFTWRKTDPHIQLQMRVSGLLDTPSETLLTDLQAAVSGKTHINR